MTPPPNDHVMELLYFATKAPSACNSQPWKFKIIGSSCIEVYPDMERAMPAVDPTNRALFVSVGCATENLLVGAGGGAYVVEGSHVVARLPSPKTLPPQDHAAKTRAILMRRTDRGVYDGRVADLSFLDALDEEEGVFARRYQRDSAEVSAIKQLVRQANDVKLNDPNYKREILTWTTATASSDRNNGDGLAPSLRNKSKVAAHVAPIAPRFVASSIASYFYDTPDEQTTSDFAKIDSSSHLILLSAAADSVKNWIALGVYLERVLLKLAEMGLAVSYCNKPIEVPDIADNLMQTLGLKKTGEVPGLVLRVGYPLDYDSAAENNNASVFAAAGATSGTPFKGASPRRNIEDCIMV